MESMEVWAGVDVASRCLFAVPKKGRLFDKLMPLLEKIGVTFVRKNRLDIAHVPSDHPTFGNLSLVFLPAHDIATFVACGRVDFGITGLDVAKEAGKIHEVTILKELGFGVCRLALCVPLKQSLEPEAYIGKRIATSFPNLSTSYFNALDPSRADTTKIFNISGSVEVSCALGLADAIVDLVETGSTLRASGLKEVSTIVESQAVLICNPNSKHHALAKKVATRLEGILTAQSSIMIEFDIPRNLLDKAIAVVPGRVSPTVSPLDDPEWVAVRVLHPKKDENDALDSLESIGAVAIVVTQIVNVRG